MQTYHLRLLSVVMDSGDVVNVDSFMKSETPIGAVNLAGEIFTYSHSVMEGGEPVYVYRLAVSITADEFAEGHR